MATLHQLMIRRERERQAVRDFIRRVRKRADERRSRFHLPTLADAFEELAREFEEANDADA